MKPKDRKSTQVIFTPKVLKLKENDFQKQSGTLSIILPSNIHNDLFYTFRLSI